jgi:exodeoxyribonuclease V gamma subunit
MEVLYDRMLDWFDRDSRLAPRDIVVMMPNVESYAPFIQAVFGSPEDESRRIPFNLADRGARRESHVIDTFLKLLALPDSRLGSATVLAPLETPALRERFGLSEAALETLRDWVRVANIRWGIDAAHRERLGLPAFAGQTWRAGLDRLLLGHAMAGHGQRLFDGILPLDGVEGDAAALAGRLAEYIERIFELVHALDERRRLDEWAGLLHGVLDGFFVVSEDSEREFQVIRGQLEALRRQQRDAGFTRPIGRAALLERLCPALDEDLNQAGFLTGGVTFCGFKPMRSIPFRIVCLVGMDDGAFPRLAQQLSFDLMAQAPRLGDRSTREDDRYLFLETLLSARDRLYISYVGQSVKDNSPAPPSVLVSELLDYVEQGFTLARGAPSSGSARTELNATIRLQALPLPLRGGEGRGEGAAQLVPQKRDELELGAPTRAEQALGAPTVRDHLVTRHRLQAFHEDYFNNSHLQFFSYSAENCRASVSARDARHSAAPFLDRPLAEPGPDFRRITLEDLTRFFFNPAKSFLRHRLGIVLADTPEELDEREPVLLDGLGQFRLRADVLQRRLAGQGASASQPLAEANGELPPGAVGEVGYAQCASRVEAFAARLETIRVGPPSPCDFSVSIGEFLVTGRVRERTAAGPLAFRCGRLRARDLLGAWLQHLVANCAQPGQTTTLLCEDSRREFTPPADAHALLAALLELYWQGLRAPLKFFPESALKFAETERTARRANSASPFDKARGEWEGNEFNDIKGEREDAAFDLCFRHEEALDETFAAHARAIFGPVLAHETRFEA